MDSVHILKMLKSQYVSQQGNNMETCQVFLKYYENLGSQITLNFKYVVQ